MRRGGFLLSLLLPVVFLAGCQPPEQSARDVIAASKGAIQTAQTKYHDACVKDANGAPCVAVTKAIGAQHVAIDALNIYCQFSPQADPATKCQPVKGALPALQSALVNLNAVTSDLKGLLQ